MLVYAHKSGCKFLLRVRFDFRSVSFAASKWFISFFDSGNSDSISDTLIKKNREQKSKSTEGERKPSGICCANCHALLTHSQHAIAVEGGHRHILTNPNGLTFNVGLYRQVKCIAETTVEKDFSWFTGYAWRIIACPECAQHIGWSYQKGHSPDFYGLIIDKLIFFEK